MSGVLLESPAGLLTNGQTLPLRPSLLAVSNGLVGYWGFDPDCVDTAGLNAFDLSGLGNTGTLQGTTKPSLAAGQVGTAFKFDGSTSDVSVADNSSLNLSAVSVSVWVNFSSLANAYTAPVSKNPSSTAFYQILVKSSGQLAVYVSNGSSIIFYDGTGAFTLVTGIWYHLAFSYNSTLGLRGYVNGRVDGTAAANGALSSQSGAPLFIGQDGRTAGRFMNGFIDDVRVYNRAISPSEVIDLYQAGFLGRRDGAPAECEMPALFASATDVLMAQILM